MSTDEDNTRPAQLPALGARGMLRWAWRQLTSMRVALMLLVLLAVVAVPGSLLPQRSQDPAGVAEYLANSPTLGAWLDRLGFFEVYTSVWFSAVYLLLFVSLVGCIVPRTLVHARALRARPPRTPRRFDRFSTRASFTTTASPDDVVARAVAGLRRGRRFRVDRASEADGALTVAAERGYLRETGNLLFHLALVGLLVAVATGQLLHYRGQALLVEGRGFANAVTDYDTFESGAAFTAEQLHPFTMTLERFESEFTADARPRDFRATVTVRDPAERTATIRVNHPLTVGDAKVYLQGNGYAPDVTVRDAAGEVAFAGPVPFLPEDDVYTSRGVIKVPDVSTGEQIGLTGYLLPTAEVSDLGVRSLHPLPHDPVLVLTVWTGDLGLDDGVPQNVYELQTAGLTQVTDDDGVPATLVLRPGDQVELPGGGSLTWEGLPRFVALDLRHDPALPWIGVFSALALVGLTLSLFTPRRRIWLRVRADGGTTVVEAAALARGDDPGLADELERVLEPLGGPQGTTDEVLVGGENHGAR